jgi:hypothetical protein
MEEISLTESTNPSHADYAIRVVATSEGVLWWRCVLSRAGTDDSAGAGSCDQLGRECGQPAFLNFVRTVFVDWEEPP